MTMRRDLVLQAFVPHVGDAIVVATYQACFDWMAICPRDLNYVAIGAMGQASSHALGLALGRPDIKVLVFDGDGSLLMNLGSLVTIAGVAPQNLHHFVFANGVYEVNGAHPIPGGGNVDFAGMARSAGYRSADRHDDLDRFAAELPHLLARTGPTLHDLRITAGVAYPRDYDAIHGSAARARFKAALTASPCRR